MAHARSADSATKANSATTAGSGANAANATNAADADQLQGHPASEFGGGMMTGHINLLDTNTGTTFAAGASGISTASNSDVPVSMLTPNEPIVASDLAVELTTAPGVNSRRRFFIWTDGVTDVTCTVIETNTTCTSGAASDVIPPGSQIEIRNTNVGNNPAASDAFFGWRAEVAP